MDFNLLEEIGLWIVNHNMISEKVQWVGSCLGASEGALRDWGVRDHALCNQRMD